MPPAEPAHPSPAPLILTASFAPEDQARFDRLRTLHFPAHLNHIAAHLTLFHHLPGDALAAVQAECTRLAAAQPGCTARVTGLRGLGRGTALALDCPALARIRAALARAFADRLTAQDRQGWRPHVTVQNKVSAAEAAALQAHMGAAFSPFTVRVEGLSLWHYRGGPWSAASHHPFAPSPPG